MGGVQIVEIILNVLCTLLVVLPVMMMGCIIWISILDYQIKKHKEKWDNIVCLCSICIRRIQNDVGERHG